MIEQIPLELIDANPWQTRQTENPDHVEEIARSIKALGMMQTPAARRVDGRVQLVFGHTRFAAFLLLNNLGTSEDYQTMPLTIRDLTDEQMAIAAFDENEKRRDLNPVEKARAVQKMLSDFGWTQEQLAEKLHIDRSGISNMIRMLRLPDTVLQSVETGVLPVRSAMAILPLYELTKEEAAALDQRFGDSMYDFLKAASDGEFTSDVIRARVEFYQDFTRADVKIPSDEEAEVIGSTEPAVSEAVEIAEAPVEIAHFVDQTQSAVHPTQLDINTWLENNTETIDQESAGTSTIGLPLSEPYTGGKNPSGQGDEAAILQNHPTTTNADIQERQVQTTNPGAKEANTNPPAGIDQPDPYEILFTITYRTKGVIVGVKKPGMQSPKLRFLQHLRLEEVPGVMREMGLG